MKEAGECICEVVHGMLLLCHAGLMQTLWPSYKWKTRVSSHGIAALLLQQHPGKPRTWMPVVSWGHCLEPLEKMESHVLLELKALHEGTWKMGEFMAFSQKLTMQVTPELWALLKVDTKGTSRAPGDAHRCPTVQAYMGHWRHVSTT